MASALARRLGIPHALAFDLNAACSGWLYALEVGRSLILTGTAKNLIVVTAELLSRITNPQDHETAFLFGDGAGAVVLEASNTPGILASDLHADGKHVGILCVPGHVSGGAISGDPVLKMDGQI
jgi:3-oxoacyl-[acyl-carrier-protein] synthase-3